MLRRIPPFLRVSDDVLEGIVQAATQQDDGYYDHRSIVTLSHICARVRHIILRRASFWNHLHIEETILSGALQAVFRRSQSVPLHIHIFGTGGFKPICDPGRMLERLFKSVAGRVTEAESLCIANFHEIDNEMLSRACETVEPMHGNVHLHRLSIEFSPFNDSTLHLVVGVHLASLNLTCLQVPLAPTLSKIFHLAPNIEILRVFGPMTGEPSHPHESVISEPAVHGLCLQILEMGSEGDDGDFAHIIELVQRYSPQAVLDGRIVALRDAFDATCITKMELDRFTDAQSIICDRNVEFTIQYPAWVLPIRRPIGRYALTELQREGDLVTRGFNTIFGELLDSESPSRKVLRYSIMSARLLKFCNAWPGSTLKLFLVLAQDAWPMLEHISLELYPNLPHRGLLPTEWNRRPIDTPRLRTVDIILCGSLSGRYYQSPSEEDILSWANPCIALINAISPPDTARFTLRHEENDDDAGISAVFATIRKAFSSHPSRFTD